MNIFRQRGQNGARVEQFVLDAAQDNRELSNGRTQFLQRHAGLADERVQFIDGAVAIDAGIGLTDALPADEGGLAFIPLAGIDAVDSDAGLVEVIG